MTISEFNNRTLQPVKNSGSTPALTTYEECFKSFATLCTSEAEQTFGTDAFETNIKGLKGMSDFYAKNNNGDDVMESIVAIRSYCACKMWDTYKTTYRIDPEFFEVFKNTDHLKVFPTELIYTPVPSFAIDLSAIPELNADGLYVSISGTIGGITLCVSALFDANIYQNISTIRFNECNADNELLTYDYNKNSLFSSKDLEKSGKTIKDNAEKIIESVYNGDKDAFLKDLDKTDKEYATAVRLVYDPEYNASIAKEMETLKLFVFQFLTYLSCKNPDIKETRDSKKRADRALRMKNPNPTEKTYDVGKVFGQFYALIKEKQKERQKSDNLSIPHNSPIPHLVSAHWQGYWCGENRSEYVLKWISCYFKGDKTETCEIVHECVESRNIPYSHGEKMIYQTLDAMKISHTPQYRIPSGKIFDDCALIHGRQIMIEFDGKQHFEPVKNWDYEITYRSDNEKNEYCKERNIPLLRIKYTEMPYISDILRDLYQKTQYFDNFWLSDISIEEYYKDRAELEEDKEII